MIRLAISVEGRTEEEFVNNLLADHLRARGVEPQPILLNGNVTIERLASDLAKLIWNFDRVTSLVDFYGFCDKNTATPEQLEQLIRKTVNKKVNRSWNELHVIPYVQQYEFEGLLFADVNNFEKLIGVSHESIQALRTIRSNFPTPEDINDNIDTAPSKRIKAIIPRYNKRVDGPLLAKETGLPVIRAECPRFSDWMTRLESLGNQN